MRKGQYALVEQVILFALGISITLGFLFTFKDLRDNVAEDVKTTQSALVSEYVASTSVELVVSGAEGRMEVDVPERIAGETYALRLGEGGVLVEMAGERKLAPLYGLESRTGADGSVESTQGVVSLTLSDGSLGIGRPE